MQRNYRTIFGIVLILAGFLLLAQRLGYVGGQWDDAIRGLSFGLGTFYFASLFFSDRSRWWAAMLGFIFLSFTASQFIEVFFPAIPGSYAGISILLFIGLGFLAIYFANKEMWWALIPGGVMLSLSTIVAVENLFPQIAINAGGLLFIGLGLTFLVLYFLRVPGVRLFWAIYPAISLFVFGLFVAFEGEEVWNLVWPALIVLLGLYLIFGAFRRK